MLGFSALTGLNVFGSVLMSSIFTIQQHLHDVLLSYLWKSLHLLLPLDAFTFHYTERFEKLHEAY